MKKRRMAVTMTVLFFIVSLGIFFIPDNAGAESKDSPYGDEMKALEMRHKEEIKALKQRQKEEKEALKARYKHKEYEKHDKDKEDGSDREYKKDYDKKGVDEDEKVKKRKFQQYRSIQ